MGSKIVTAQGSREMATFISKQSLSSHPSARCVGQFPKPWLLLSHRMAFSLLTHLASCPASSRSLCEALVVKPSAFAMPCHRYQARSESWLACQERGATCWAGQGEQEVMAFLEWLLDFCNETTFLLRIRPLGSLRATYHHKPHGGLLVDGSCWSKHCVIMIHVPTSASRLFCL